MKVDQRRRSFAVATIVLAVICWGCGCGNSGSNEVEDAKSDIREQLPAGAGIPWEEFQVLVSTAAAPRLENFASQPLSLVALQLRGNDLDESHDKLKAEFRYTSTTPKPSDILDAMSVSRSKGYASVIQPETIQEITCKVVGDSATGTVSFAIKNCLEGRVHYVAKKENDKWKLVEFSFPAYQATTSLGKNGKWRASGIGIVPIVSLRLPRVDELPKRLDSPNRFVIYLGNDANRRDKELFVAIDGNKAKHNEFAPLLEKELAAFLKLRGIKASQVVCVIRADGRAATGVVRHIIEKTLKRGVRDFQLTANTRLDQENPDLFLPVGEATIRPALAAVRGGEGGDRLVEPQVTGESGSKDAGDDAPVRVRALSAADGSLDQIVVGESELKPDLNALRNALAKIVADDQRQGSIRLEPDYALRYEEFMRVYATCSGTRGDNGDWIPLIRKIRLAPMPRGN